LYVVPRSGRCRLLDMHVSRPGVARYRRVGRSVKTRPPWHILKNGDLRVVGGVKKYVTVSP
jgi:hypothetical protein